MLYTLENLRLPNMNHLNAVQIIRPHLEISLLELDKFDFYLPWNLLRQLLTDDFATIWDQVGNFDHANNL